MKMPIRQLYRPALRRRFRVPAAGRIRTPLEHQRLHQRYTLGGCTEARGAADWHILNRSLAWLDRITDPRVLVYVVDKGVNYLPEFQNRLLSGVNVNGSQDTCDETGHGTMVASFIIGNQSPVRNNALVVPIKIRCDANCFTAVMWAIDDAEKRPQGCIIVVSGVSSSDPRLPDLAKKAKTRGILLFFLRDAPEKENISTIQSFQSELVKCINQF
ncbi:hypothetical protein TRVA0_013S01244 [Trichomonascus vanleenenianus]|uniref:uncharacterized protein n=1 Tax=Trichomonascus vanleenenianus TaxID=2268995 RepID=UPI003ECB6A99